MNKKFTKYITDQLNKATKEPFDAREISEKYTTDVVSSCIFDADAESFTKDKPEIREMGRKLMAPTGWLTFWFMLYAIVPSFQNIFKVKIIPKDVEDFFINIMNQAVKYRIEKKVTREDYLAHLIALKNKKEVSDIDIAAHGVTFFIDGFETSSIAIAHTFYEVNLNFFFLIRMHINLQT